MPITSFSYAKFKCLEHVECKNVPPLMIIAGPNGVGKTALIEALAKPCQSPERKWITEHSGPIVFMSSNRTWSRESLRRTQMLNWCPPMVDLLGERNLGTSYTFDDLNGREPGATDKIFSVSKRTIGNLHQIMADLVVQEFNNQQSVGEKPDVFAPIKVFVDQVFPHLEFVGIDIANGDDVKCLFRRRNSDPELLVDIDHLSSGERATFSMLLPFLELQVLRSLAAIGAKFPGSAKLTREGLTLLIDEPEVHLHPVLQSRLLEFFRQVCDDEKAQFIITTHSPTMINEARAGELYVLVPPKPSKPENQLVQLSESDTRLEAIRSLCGDLYRITSCRRVVCVEGTTDQFREHPHLHAADFGVNSGHFRSSGWPQLVWA